MTARCCCCRLLCTAALVSAAFWGAPALNAQESKSAALVKELTDLLASRNLDAIAAKAPGSTDEFVGALFFPGSQLLVVSARYSVPVLLDEKLKKKDYRDIYVDLNSAAVPNSKTFVYDLGADGLKARREEGQPFDSVDLAARSVRFDNDWRAQRLTEEEYMKAFADADQKYSAMLSLLIAELKKTS